MIVVRIYNNTMTKNELHIFLCSGELIKLSPGYAVRPVLIGRGNGGDSFTLTIVLRPPVPIGSLDLLKQRFIDNPIHQSDIQ